MTKCFLIYLFLTFSCTIQAQSKEILEKHLTNSLSYQHIKYKTAGKESQISIHQIEIKNCSMSYPIFIKKGNKTERFTVRILLSGINEITTSKAKEGYYAVNFALLEKHS